MAKNKSRRLKVEKSGDFYRHKIKPLIRLQGNWLREAGVEVDKYIVVSNPSPGVLIIQVERR